MLDAFTQLLSGFMNNPIFRTGIRVADILIVAAFFYNVYLLLVNTRAYAVFQGIALIFFFTFVAKVLNFAGLSWLLDKALEASLITVVILFQSEIKRGLILLGQNTFFSKMFRFDTANLYKIINAAYALSKKRFGGLIVIKRKISLQGILEKAVILNAEISSELIETIYYHHNPLHDGAIIVDQSHIIAASAYLPLTEGEQDSTKSRRLGTRHRAALGISEQSDAVVVVVSEETAAVSLVYNGRLYYNLGREELGSKLETLLGVEIEERETQNKEKK